ncbi:MAG: YggS family pyridoxal phosphate-dependent enzyme [Flavobacteriales bacterium]|jgi:PLP dependent protein|nr:YggS family pyridoxal phosphate-dependent enzyme [Flavobacteriales bacterium]MDP4716203.1 YggS family pyridoxal phosphate-dependent enzyme [Flavobacteriales bacterium]MDP4732338.1 YggS family pyridoxal phosphate-dependent enzyme [Flavobacteriales bacterium]MDP4818543.1 YggS family pyridoxal phosphate-dependent enzyme [Flavobacteriales bacterium]MDP4950895.1 YggS family pyridoxal phosphate-dependent enzyme [Flavobacteriales bacterium]
MSHIQDQIKFYTNQFPSHVKLVAVSKTKPVQDLQEAYAAGQRIFGENYVQELVDKHTQLPTDIEWHFIGNLQSNKVKYIAPFVALIHGVNSISTLKEIDKQAKKLNKQIEILLQLHVATEESKFGFSEEEVLEIASQKESYSNVNFRGVMGMASFTEDQSLIRKEFQEVNRIFSLLKPLFGENFNEISMGMSGDWEIAVEEGSTLVRIGSAIFGSR